MIWWNISSLTLSQRTLSTRPTCQHLYVLRIPKNPFLLPSRWPLLNISVLVMETDGVSQESQQTLFKCSSLKTSVFWFGNGSVRCLPKRIPHSSESRYFCYLIHSIPHSSKSYHQCLGKVFASTEMVAHLCTGSEKPQQFFCCFFLVCLHYRLRGSKQRCKKRFE